MSRRPTIARIALVVAALLVVAGCGVSNSPPKQAEDQTNDSSTDPLLVLQGHASLGDEVVTEAPARARARTRTRESGDVVEVEEWPELPLTDAGTIDAGPDPYADQFVPVHAMPIEDDPRTTATIARSARMLRLVDHEDWDAWMGANNRSPWQQDYDANSASVVEVTVERCGGARSVATGVVLADELVATTSHVVENAAARVRVAPAVGASTRIPAMIRYLDVDDDVAILRVPGLQVEPMPLHTPSSVAPTFGYAYGVAPVGRAGTLRRVPVLATQVEEPITTEQPDGFAQQISDRSVNTLVGGITSGFSGGVVVATNDANRASGWGFHGLLRARMSLREDTAGIVIPARIVAEAIAAESQLEEWFEHRPGGCPQWFR